ELGGEPVEQLRVGRPHAVEAKITRRRHESGAEMILPHAVDDAAPRQRVLRIGDPMRERGATRAFRRVFRQDKSRGPEREHRERAWADLGARLRHLPAEELMDLARLTAVCASTAEIAYSVINRAGEDYLGLWKPGQPFIQLCDFDIDRIPFLSRFR